jgi:iron complex transport system ATP-binding protein
VPALELTNVTLWVVGPEGRVELVRALDWTIEHGEHWAVLGPNGAGKSSLLSICVAMRHPSQGAAQVLGETFGHTDMRSLRERIGVVDSLVGSRVPGILTLEDVALTGANGTVLPRREGYTEVEIKRADVELLRVGLDQLRHRQFRHCSQGERQRALLARALVGEPELLVLDEAAVGLDLPAREAMLAGLASAAAETPGRASITVTHHVEELPGTTTHALLLRGGALVAAGPVGEVLRDDLVSETFGLPVQVSVRDGRWSAHAAPGWSAGSAVSLEGTS